MKQTTHSNLKTIVDDESFIKPDYGFVQPLIGKILAKKLFGVEVILNDGLKKDLSNYNLGKPSEKLAYGTSKDGDLLYATSAILDFAKNAKKEGYSTIVVDGIRNFDSIASATGDFYK